MCSQEARLLFLAPQTPTPTLWKILCCSFHTQMEVYKRLEGHKVEGYVDPLK
jgi:hypothetical protein